MKAPTSANSKVPEAEGYYWALWVNAAHGKYDDVKLFMDDWGIVQVVGRPGDFMVLVPGVREFQHLSDFAWGDRVIRPGEESVDKTDDVGFVEGDNVIEFPVMHQMDMTREGVAKALHNVAEHLLHQPIPYGKALVLLIADSECSGVGDSEYHVGRISISARPTDRLAAMEVAKHLTFTDDLGI